MMIIDLLRARFQAWTPDDDDELSLVVARQRVQEASHVYFPIHYERNLTGGPDNIYGENALEDFTLPAPCVAVEDNDNCILLADLEDNQRGVNTPRWFMRATVMDAEKFIIPPTTDLGQLRHRLEAADKVDGFLIVDWGLVNVVLYRSEGAAVELVIHRHAEFRPSGTLARCIEWCFDTTSKRLLSSLVVNAYEELGYLQKLAREGETKYA